MISYELAKELKKNGFPQNENPSPDQGFWYGKHEDETVFMPFLSSLIEACGKSFYELRRLDSERSNAAPVDGHVWEASSPDVSPMLYIYDSPEEAVARLYLALHPKHTTQT